MITIALLLWSVCFVVMIAGVCRALAARHWLTIQRAAFEQSRGTPVGPSPKFILLVPALREQAVIGRTLGALTAFHYDASAFRIVVALTSEELPDATGDSTAAAIERFRQQRGCSDPQIRVVAAPPSTSARGRAYQLNLALQHTIAELQPDAGATFVGVYDADSSPDPRVLEYIAWAVAKNPLATAFQQILDYQLNMPALWMARGAPVLAANAAYQTAWNLISEVPRFLQTNKELCRGRAPSFPPYCMGHGEFIRLDTLLRQGGFSTNGPADGIQLGISLTLGGTKIYPVPYPDGCESPTDLRSLAHQHSHWFAGSVTAFRLIAASEQRTLAKCRQWMNHLLLDLKWLFRPLFCIAAVVPAATILLSAQTFLLTTACAAVILATFIGYTIFIAAMATPRHEARRFWLTIAVPFAVCFKSVGAWIGLGRLIAGRLTGHRPTFRKVERIRVLW